MRWWPATGCVAALVLGLSAGTAFAAPPPGPEVAPGIFLAEASEVADADASPAESSVEHANRSSRIVGGNATTIAEWPWQVAITQNPAIYAGNGFQRQFCGGSLVAPNIVITAAHCTFEVFGSSGFDDPSNFASITGRTTLSNSGQGQEIAWSDYFVLTDASGRPLYNPSTSEWDVVFAQLASPSPSSNSTPIMIAGADEAAFWAPGDENAFATGWGTTLSGGIGPFGKQDTLRAVQIDVIADTTCGSATSYGTGFRRQTMVCAGEIAGGQDTCQGDSGGPLVVPIGGGAFRLVGDTSFGNGCALPNFPGVYGRLAQDPMCTALQNGIQAVAGVNVVGSPGSCSAAGDSSPPETLITQGPKKKTKKKRARFAFTSTEPGSTFDCQLDDGRKAFTPCTSPITVKVKKGKHTFQVEAIDQAGNVGSPATDDWKVKKK
jgi:trypsin